MMGNFFHIPHFVVLLVALLAALQAVRVIYHKVLAVALLKGIVDNPNARKRQKEPIPVLGGMAVFFGMLVGMMTFMGLTYAAYLLGDHAPTMYPVLASMGKQLPLFLGCVVMLYVGSLDDILGLTPRARVAAEIFVILAMIYGSGICIDSFHGLWGVGKISWWVGVPLSVLTGVGLINAYNMVDGVNGLSSGLCMFGSVSLAFVFYRRGDYPNCSTALCFGASLLPFFLHNVFGRRSRMYIGDAGSMVMGLLVTWFVMRVMSTAKINPMEGLPDALPPDMGLCAMLLAITSVPVFDTLRVMTGRMLHGRSPFKADRTHLHHMFVDSNVTHANTTMCEVGINILILGIWYVTYRCGMDVTWQLYTVIAASVLLVWGTYFFLRNQRKHNTALLRDTLQVGMRERLGNGPILKRIERFMDRKCMRDERRTTDWTD